jgi:hypothetical protein
MPDNPEPNPEPNPIQFAIEKMEEWIKTAQIAIEKTEGQIATKLKTPIHHKLIQRALSEKKELYELLSQDIYKLNITEIASICEPVNQMNQLEKTLRENLLISQGKGRTKKRKSRHRRNKRHRKSTRSRHRKH